MKHMDKLHHIAYSFALAVAGAFFVGPVWGLLLAAMAGITKEFYDACVPGHQADFWDLAANAVGLLAAWVVIG